MKKKILVILLSFSIMTLAAGCSGPKAEPEKEALVQEQQPETDVSGPEDISEAEEKAPDPEPEAVEEKEEVSAEPEELQPESASKIPLEKGLTDENTTAVVYYEFKKDYGSDGANVSGTLEFEIPQLTMKSVEAGKINEDILKYFEKRLDETDEVVDFLGGGAMDPDDSDMSVQYTLEIGYEMTYLDESKVCLLLSGYEYSGGAHGMPFRKSLIYDLESGERLDAEDLFDVGEDEFSAAFIAAFETCMAESEDGFWADAMDYVKEGASFENEDFYLTESGTVFYFEPYVLASYASGYIEAEVPYDKVGLK